MTRVLALGGAVAVLLALGACDTTSPAVGYMPSTQNVIAIQGAMKGGKVAVSDFATGPGLNTRPLCRLDGPLDVTAGKPMGQYLKDAMESELFQAQALDTKSPVVISTVLNEMKVGTLGTGSWTLGLQVSSNKDPQGYYVRVDRPFSSSYTAVGACRNAVNAFAPTVQQLLGEVVNNPDFGKLSGVN